MKKVMHIILFSIGMISFTMGQAPQGFKYQTVIRKNNVPLSNQLVRIKTSILQSSSSGKAAFSQIDTITTNTFGLVNLIIGNNGTDSGSLQNIDWSLGPYYIKTELDETGGMNFHLMGTSQIMSVPFALYSAKTNTQAKFEIDGTVQLPVDTALFEVKDSQGRTVFAVYEDGVVVYVSEGAKGAKSGFTVGGRSPGAKGYLIDEIMRVTPDSIRFYIADSSLTKGNARAFSVVGSSFGNAAGDNIFYVTGDSTRIYTADSLAGFGIGSLTKNQAPSNYLRINGFNTSIGNRAGKSLVRGTWNTMLGYQAGMSSKNANQNVFVGYNAGMSNTIGDNNIFIGSNTGVYNIDGINNTYLGDSAGYSNLDGNFNVFLGLRSGKNSLGSANVYVGNRSGYNNIKGNGNTFVGIASGCDDSQTSDSGNVYLGHFAGYNIPGSNQLIISNAATDTASSLIYGEFSKNKLRINKQLGINMEASVNALEVNGNAYKTSAGGWLVPSDSRIKSNIEEIENAQQTILKLHPVKFRYSSEWITRNPGLEDAVYYNYLAQEFSEVFPQSVKSSGQYIKGDSKELLQMDSYNAQVVTVKAVQELILENKSLQMKVEELAEEVEKLKQKSDK